MWPSIASFWIFLAIGSQACSPSRDAVRLTCPDDIYLVADKNSASAAVSWDAKDFRVISSHQIKGLYQTVPVHGASATVRRTFQEGTHFVEYKAVDAAGNHGDCSFTVTVKVVQCPPLYNPQFGIVTCDSSNLYGSQCSISCIPGYVAVGMESVCQEDGRWSYDLAYCRMTTCSDPGTPLFGTRKCTTSTHAYGSVCEFDCSRGYQLLGNRRIVCQSVDNRTQWSDPAPICQEIIPPKVEICPTSVVTAQVTSSGTEAEVQLPRIMFRTSSGAEAPFVCSHYGPHDRSRNFSLGLHDVTCTATDPVFGSQANTSCSFSVRVRANPCRPLAQPINGLLLCSGSHGGGDSAQRTNCQLFCNQGFVPPRFDDGPQSNGFVCDHAVGSWQPSSFVPSCVVPNRPTELKLPAEILFHSSNCSNAKLQTDVRTKFQAALQNNIRGHSACVMNPGECIVEDVITDCQMTSSARRRRHGRHHDVTASSSSLPSPSLSSTARRRYIRRHANTRLSFLLSIKFHFSTRLPSSGGDWPDEYHRASHRLYSIFDYFKQQVDGGTFTIHHGVQSLQMEEVNNSVADSPVKTICDIGHDFNRAILLCVPCGPGTYFNNTLDRCERCPDGTRQTKQGQYLCY